MEHRDKWNSLWNGMYPAERTKAPHRASVHYQCAGFFKTTYFMPVRAVVSASWGFELEHFVECKKYKAKLKDLKI